MIVRVHGSAVDPHAREWVTGTGTIDPHVPRTYQMKR